MIVPIRKDKPAQTFRAKLGDVTVRFHVFYVRRRGAWYFHMDDAQGNRLLSGVKLVSTFPLLRQYQANSSLPPGVLMLMDYKLTFDEPDRDSLGDNHILLYEEV